MPRFSPFRGVRYTVPSLDSVLAPPYDVISPDDRTALLARDERNAVRLELPDSWESAASLWRSWLDGDVLRVDDAAAFYVYRMTFDGGRGRGGGSTTGVLGALGLTDDVLAHEQTTPKDRADRLGLLSATRVNLSPIWALTPAPLPLGSLTAGAPDARGVDPGDGVVHELWRVTDAGAVAAISAAVAAQPALIADGHHRWEVANAYHASSSESSAGTDAVLAFVVELAPGQLAVRAIHRLLSGLPEGFDVVAALSSHFDVTAAGGAPPSGEPVDSLVLRTQDGAWLLQPTPATVSAAAHDLDSSRLDVALAASFPPDVSVVFQHGWDLAVAAVDKGDAQAAVLLRPAAVAQIAAVASGGSRMPPKTTFFFPKPATGMVFRALDVPA